MLAIAHGNSDAQQFVPSKNPPEICHVGSLFSGSSLASQHRSKPLGSVQHCSERLMATHTAQSHYLAYLRHFLACCLKTSVRTAQNRRLGTAKHCSGPLKTSSRQLQDDFGTTSEPPQGLHPDRKTALSRTTQNQLGASSRPLLGLQAAKHCSEPLKTSSKPARDTAQHRSKPARASSRPAQTSAKLTSAGIVHGMHGHTLV